MDYEYDEDSWSMFPPGPEYPPIIPSELTACLGEAQAMRKECDCLKSTMGKVLEKIRLAKYTLEQEPK